MKNPKKDKKFNDFIFDNYNDSDKYNLCVLIYHIHIAAHKKIINEVSIRKNEISEHSKIYDLEYGFEEPEYIEINGIKMLSI